MITLGQTKSDYINQMITITDYFYLVIFSKWDVEMWSRVITLTSDCIMRLSLYIIIFARLKKETTITLKWKTAVLLYKVKVFVHRDEQKFCILRLGQHEKLTEQTWGNIIPGMPGPQK